MQESIVFLVRVQWRRKESSRSLSHLLMSFLLLVPESESHKKQGLHIPAREYIYDKYSWRCQSFFSRDMNQIVEKCHRLQRWRILEKLDLMTLHTKQNTTAATIIVNV